MKFYPSQLKTYLQCPYKYHVFYVERRSREFRISTPALSFGRSVHNALRAFYEGGAFRRYSENDLKELLQANWQADGFADEAGSQAAQSEALELLQGYYARARGHPARPVALEKNLEAVFDLDGEPLVLGGRLDRLDRQPEGGLVVVDYKTGRSETADAYHLKRDLATIIYSLVVLWRYPGASVASVRYILLRRDMDVAVSLTEEEMDTGLEHIRRIAREIKARGDFPTVANPLCPWCGIQIKGQCPSYVDNPLPTPGQPEPPEE
ncbi:MAG: PD-(D/E)XK nuclease family protein [Chloroflexota bacterium]